MIRIPVIRLMAVSLLATTVVSSAIADMVYDDETTMSAAPSNVEVRTVISNSANNNNLNSNAPSPIAMTPDVISESNGMQKTSERSKQKRGFQESVNNELVIQKLEDKRLKQEEKLTSEINRKFTLEDDTLAGTAAPVMKEVRVVKPITEAYDSASSYEMSEAPKPPKNQVKIIGSDEVTINQSSTNMSVAPAMGKSEGESDFKGGVSITPRAGLATMSNSYFEMKNQYALGIGLGFDVSDNVGVGVGYTFASYQIGLMGAPNYGGYSLNQLSYKSNTIDMGMKLFLTGRDSRVRPFVGGGLGYTIGYVNYDASMAYNQNFQGQDYQLNQFQGMLQAGIEFKIASNISLGMTYKYLRALSSSETQDGLYSSSFYSPYGYQQPLDPQKQALRYSLRDSSTQMFLVGTTVTF